MLRAVSKDFTTVMMISKKEFEKILAEEDKGDFEKFREIADKISFRRDFSDLKIVCANCESKYHATYDCTKVYFDKDPLYISRSCCTSLLQDRRTLKRRDRSNINTLAFTQTLLEVVDLIKYDYALHNSEGGFTDDDYEEVEVEEEESSRNGAKGG